MSKNKKKRRTPGEKRNAGKVIRLPLRKVQSPTSEREQKLSEIIKEMASVILQDPDAIPSRPAAVATLMLAGAAWNSAVGDSVMLDQHRKLVEQIDWSGVPPWAELRTDDSDKLIAELVAYKHERYPGDLRRIVATEMTPEGNVRVHWTEAAKIVTAEFGSTSSKATVSKEKRGHPIADKLVKKMNRYVRAKVIDLEAVKVGRANAEELQTTVASREELADHHPAHAIYVYAQNQVSVMSEQLTALKEMARFVKLISNAEEEYMPSGPPMSPLTASFFTCWAFFDACVGVAEETIATITMAVGSAFGMRGELLQVVGLMQQSRMAVYVHEGVERDTVLLRELVTDTVCRAIVPSGYRGHKGELWYVRVLPPPLPGIAEHVVFTTPYLLVQPGEREWQSYFRRTLPDAPLQGRIARYEQHMKFGPTREYWTEFVFEAYVNHRADVIFLAGLPDVPQSRPHSRINSR